MRKKQLLWALFIGLWTMLHTPTHAQDKNPLKNSQIIIPKENLTPQERKFLECLQEIQTIDFPNSNIKAVSPPLRKFIEKLFDFDMQYGHLTVKYDTTPAAKEKTFLNWITIGFGYRATLKLFRSALQENWRRVEFTCYTNEKGRFIPPSSPPPGQSGSKTQKTMSCDFHPNGQLKTLTYLEIKNGELFWVDHITKWKLNGDLQSKEELTVPRKIRLRVGSVSD